MDTWFLSRCCWIGGKTVRRSREETWQQHAEAPARSVRTQSYFTPTFPEIRALIAYKDGGNVEKYGLPVSSTAFTCILSRRRIFSTPPPHKSANQKISDFYAKSLRARLCGWRVFSVLAHDECINEMVVVEVSRIFFFAKQ